MDAKNNLGGFTLIELLIVIIMISIVAAIAIPSYVHFSDRAKESATKADMVYIAKGLEVYRTDHENYPLTETGIQKLEGIVLKTVPGQDSWQNDYFYQSDGWGYELRSSGSDGIPHNQDDIVIVNGIMTAFGAYANTGSETPLFESSFDSWEGLTTIMGDWSLEEGLLKPSTEQWQNRIIFGEQDWSNYTVEVRTTLLDGPGYGIYYLAQENEVSGGLDGYIFQYDPGRGNRFVVNRVSERTGEDTIGLVNMEDLIEDFEVYNQAYTISISVQDNRHIIKLTDEGGNDYTVFDFEDETHHSGGVGFRGWTRDQGSSDVDFEHVVVYQNQTSP